jgi:hypothetical protein
MNQRMVRSAKQISTKMTNDFDCKSEPLCISRWAEKSGFPHKTQPFAFNRGGGANPPAPPHSDPN